MTIEQGELEELKTLYFRRYSVLLTDEQAIELGNRLVSIFSIIGKPLILNPLCPIETIIKEDNNREE